MTILTIVVEVVVTAEHERGRGAASRELLKQKINDLIKTYSLNTSVMQLHQVLF